VFPAAELSQEVVALARSFPGAALAGPFPGVVVLAAEPFLEAVALVVEPSQGVVAPAVEPCLKGVFPAAELSQEVVALARSFPGVVVLAVEPSPGVVVAVVSVADVAAPRASGNTPVPSAASAPVSVVVGEVDIPGHPTFFAFPNVEYYARSASSDEDVGDESVRSSTGGHANYDFYSILSTLDLHHNKRSEHCYNNPSPGHNTASDTNDLPMDATRNHSRKTGLQRFQEQRKHWVYQALLLHPVVRKTRWVEDWGQHTVLWVLGCK
jgi:hypothetical protein